MLAEAPREEFKIGRRLFIILSVATPAPILGGINRVEHNKALDQRVKEIANQDPILENLLEEERFHKDMADLYQERVLSSRSRSDQSFWIASRNQEEKDRKNIEKMGNQRYSKLENNLGLTWVEKLSPWVLFGFAGISSLSLSLDLYSKLKSITTERLCSNSQRRNSHLIQHKS